MSRSRLPKATGLNLSLLAMSNLGHTKEADNQPNIDISVPSTLARVWPENIPRKDGVQVAAKQCRVQFEGTDGVTASHESKHQETNGRQ